MEAVFSYKRTMTNPTAPFSRPRRAQRRDGRSTRAVVLDAAGKVFAERGFGEATSKEICERAGTNNAAVNYYFGGKEGLYEEVLVEAHRQMLSLEDLNDIVASDALPEDKLRVFLGHIIRTAMNAPELWGIRIFLRELASPSPFVPGFIRTTALPKSRKLRELVSAVTGLPPDSATVQRATALVVMPCMGLILFPEKLRTVILPASASDAEGLLEDMLTYMLGGLHALGEARPAPPDDETDARA